jgi:hypothetical protein
VREAAGIDFGWRSDNCGTERCDAVSGERLGGGTHALSQGSARVVGGEIDAVAAVDLPVDVTRDNVRTAIATGICVTVAIAGDDNMMRAARREGKRLRGRSGRGVSDIPVEIKRFSCNDFPVVKRNLL